MDGTAQPASGSPNLAAGRDPRNGARHVPERAESKRFACRPGPPPSPQFSDAAPGRRGRPSGDRPPARRCNLHRHQAAVKGAVRT